MYDVCVIGHVVRDVNTISGREQPPQPGGTAYYASMVYRSLGLRTAIVTSVAPADEPALLGEFAARGIAVFNLPTNATTAFHNHYAANDPDIRTQRVTARAAPIAADSLPDEVAAGLYHLGPLADRDIDAAVAARCSQAGAMVALDAQGLVRRIIGESVLAGPSSEAWAHLSHVNVLKADGDEILSLTNARTLPRAIRALEPLGIDEVIITLGSRGSMVFGRGRCIGFAAVPPRRIHDATGCGDTYLAAYMARRLASDALEDCAMHGAVAASLNIEHAGPFTGHLDDITARWHDFRASGATLHMPDWLAKAFGDETDAPDAATARIAKP